MDLGQCQEPRGAEGLRLVLIPSKQLSNSQLEPWKYVLFPSHQRIYKGFTSRLESLLLEIL